MKFEKDMVINVRTQKDYDDLMEELERDGWMWSGIMWSGIKPTEGLYWNEYKENTYINLEDYKKIYYSNYSGNKKITPYPPKDLHHLEEGDILVDKDGDKRKVLGVHKYLVHLSRCDEFSSYCAYSLTIEQLEEEGYKLKSSEPSEPLEVTLDEVAEKFGVDVKNLKVKKDK